MSANRRVRLALASALVGAALPVCGATPASAARVTLDNWKLQLPTSTGEGEVDEIEPAQLRHYQSGWLNSQHSRSELREMTPAGEEAASDPAVGVHHFAVRLAVTELPDTEPEVVVAQAHNGDTGLPTIRLASGSAPVCGG